MGSEVDGDGRDDTAGGDHVVESHAALCQLEPLDDGEAAVVAHHDDHFVAREDRTVEVAVEHQVGAVADQGEDLTGGLTGASAGHAGAGNAGAGNGGAGNGGAGHGGAGHGRPPRPGDLVAHAGKAVLAVEAARRLGQPVDIELPRQAARGSEHIVLAGGGSVDGPHDLGVSRHPRPRGRRLGHHRLGVLGENAGLLGPGIGGAPVAEAGAELLQPHTGIGHQWEGSVLDGIEAGRVEADEADVVGPEHCPRAGGEVAQPGADGQDGVGLRGQAVGTVPAHDPDGAGPGRVGGDEAGLARHRLHHRHPVTRREAGELGFGHRVVDATAGHQQRSLRRAQNGSGPVELAQVGPGARGYVHRPVEELPGEVPRFGLGVLGQGQHGGAALGRVEQHPQRLRQGLDELLGPGDAVPVA